MTGFVVRTIDTSPGQPGPSISRCPARSIAHFQHRPGGEVGHWDAQHCARSGPIRKPGLVSILRTSNAPISVQPAIIITELDGQIVCQKGRNESLKSKKKDGKVKGTKVRFS